MHDGVTDPGVGPRNRPRGLGPKDGTGCRPTVTATLGAMTEPARKLLRDVLGLPEEDRIRIATELLASLDGPPDAGWSAAWEAEIERRSQAATDRGDPAPEWDEVRARILSRLGQG